MKKDKIKQELLNVINEKGSLSFVELEDLFKKFDFDYEGNLQFTISRKNEYSVVIWAGLNDEALDILDDLFNNKDIMFTPCNILIYHIDGKYINLPIAKRPRMYKKPHWLPTLICPMNMAYA